MKRQPYFAVARLTTVPFIAFIGTAMVQAQASGTFTSNGSMTTPRAGHTATMLSDGRVLITGGSREQPRSAEIYDPATKMFISTGDMLVGGSSATLLPNGKVLFAGGSSPELYDPSTGTFSTARNTPTWRAGKSVLLPDGRVLIVGGGNDHPSYRTYSRPSADLYEPSTGTVTATGNMNWGWLAPTATLLADGTVLFAVVTPWWVAGRQQEFLGAGDLYDPAAGQFSSKGVTAPMIVAYFHTASLLMNGKVLISGGGDPWDGAYGLADAGLYDPVDGTFAATGKMGTCRFSHTATLLPEGSVLIAGGNGDFCYTSRTPSDYFAAIPGSLRSAEVYDPSTGTFASTGSMTTFRQEHTATLLNDGRVLITGGINFKWGEGSIINSSAEIYTPPLLVPPPVLFSVSGDGQGQGAITHANTSRLASQADPAIAGEALEIYLDGLVDDSIIPPQVAIGGRMAEVLFFGKAPGFEGLNQVNIRVPLGAAPGPATPVRMTYLGRNSNEVTIAVR
jgi:hypothetical protein